MQSGTGYYVGLLFTPKIIILFILGMVILNIMSGAVYGLAVALLGESLVSLGVLFAVCVAAIPLIALVVKGIVERRRPVAMDVRPEQVPEKHRQIIVFVSGRPDIPHIEGAINYHLPLLQACWLVYTDQSKANADRLYEQHTAGKVKVHLVHVDDIFDVSKTFSTLKQVFHDAGLADGSNLAERDRFIVDVTGGSALWSAGAVLACLSASHDIQYMRAQYNDRGQPLPGLVAMRVPVVIDRAHLTSPSRDSARPAEAREAEGAGHALASRG
jgi:hypothetical protein